MKNAKTNVTRILAKTLLWLPTELVLMISADYMLITIKPLADKIMHHNEKCHEQFIDLNDGEEEEAEVQHTIFFDSMSETFVEGFSHPFIYHHRAVRHFLCRTYLLFNSWQYSDDDAKAVLGETQKLLRHLCCTSDIKCLHYCLEVC